MKIGIIGAGMVGTNFGMALMSAGHEVMFSSREPQGDHAQQVRQNTGAAVGLVEEVIAFSSVVAIAMPPDAVLDVARTYAGPLAGKVIIDMNNRFNAPPSGLSLSQEIAQITNARVVKALNSIGAEHYLNPVFDSQKASMLIAGGDSEARQIVGQVIGDIGFEVIDAGGLENTALLEKLAQLWVTLGRSALGRNIAFKLLRR